MQRSIRETNDSTIRERRAWLAAALNGMADAVILSEAGSDPEIIFMNTSAESLTGWSLTDAKGKKLSGVFKVDQFDIRQLVDKVAGTMSRKDEVVGFDKN